jgi:hypothetical protein
MIGIQLPDTVNYFVAKLGKIPDIACMDAGKEREQERKLCALYLTVSGTCLLNQDLFRRPLT